MSSARRVVSTYRLQLGPTLTFDDAAAQVDHLAALGISHLYLSPVLQAGPGSTHGYDVVDHSHLSASLGGEVGFRRLVRVAHAAGLGIVLDVVPNHMATPIPLSRNFPLWSVLRDGVASPFAEWFDIDWSAEDGKVLWPVLGASLEEVLATGDLRLDRAGGEDVVRYHDHVLPLARGTNVRGMPLGSVLAQQHYRLASWREGATRLNYRRFFDVTSLIGVRVEEPAVFEATHRVVLDAVRAGDVDGLRIDHPDGLADPSGYLDRLAEATAGAWTVVEKILEGAETLPRSWRTAGTTGYDALGRVGGLFVDPMGAGPLADLSAELLGAPQDLDAMVVEAKRHVLDEVLVAEVERLLRLVARALPTLDLGEARRALEALLVGLDRYRVYVGPDDPSPAVAVQLESAAVRGAADDDDLDRGTLEAVIDLALGQAPASDAEAQADFVVRFQQTCGPVMAKAVEDTTYYRFVRLIGLNEVGGDPGVMGCSVDEFHDFAGRLEAEWPLTMTTLSTHDTKRSEDVRARLAVLSERPGPWRDWVRRAQVLAQPHRGPRVDALTEYFLWQTVVGVWPVDPARLVGYATKAVREAKLHTSWTDGDPDYEAQVARFCTGLATDPAVGRHIEEWLGSTAVEIRANTLGQKAVQLLMPGVADVYQGTDLVDLSLVDPDNRRPVDYAERRRRLERLDAGEAPDDLDDEKLWVTATALRLRRDRPDVFVGETARYVPLASSSEHAFGFCRGDGGPHDVCVVVTRLAGRLADKGGWGGETMDLPSGEWREVLSGRVIGGGRTPLAEVLPGERLPVAVLVRVEGGER